MEVKLIVFIEGNCRNERDMAFWVVLTPLDIKTKKIWLIRLYIGDMQRKNEREFFPRQNSIFSCQWTFNSFVNWFEHIQFDEEKKSTDWRKWLFLCDIFITIGEPNTTVIYSCFIKIMWNFLIKIGAEDVYTNNKWIK